MFLLCKEDDFIFYTMLQGCFYIARSKFINKREAIIVPSFGKQLTVFMFSSTLALQNAQNSH